MYVAGIISSAVRQSPSFDIIIAEYKAALNFMSRLSEIEHHCVKFLSILTKIGGPYAMVSQAIQEEWIEDCKAECGVELKLGMWFNYNYEQNDNDREIKNEGIWTILLFYYFY